eukprot:scaffold106669_cov45-Phaeocystis_antarctica.AAC.1
MLPPTPTPLLSDPSPDPNLPVAGALPDRRGTLHQEVVAVPATAVAAAAVAAAQPVDAVLLVRSPARVQEVGAFALPDGRRRRIGHRQRRLRASHAALIPQPGALGGLWTKAERVALAVAQLSTPGHPFQRLLRVAKGLPAGGARVARLPAQRATVATAALRQVPDC